MKRGALLIAALVAVAVAAVASPSVEVVDLDSDAPFAADWVRARDTAGPRWIAYSVPTREANGEDDLSSFVGRYRGDRVRLDDLLPPGTGAADARVLFLVAVDGRGDDLRVADVDSTDLRFPFDLDGRHRILWIGEATAEESLSRLLPLWTRTDGADAAGELVEAIGCHDSSRATSFLARVLADEGEADRVREEAAESLAGQPGADAAAALERAIRDDRAALSIRREAAESLGERPFHEGLGAIEELLTADLPRDVRRELVESIGHRADTDAIALLDRVVWHDRDRRVRGEALETLARLPTDASIEALVRAARNHPDEATRRDAVEALGEVAAHRESARGRRALETLLEG